ISYSLPELDYLLKTVEMDPEGVTKVILATPISTETFNPEVVDRFLWIATKLPAPQLSQVVEKMNREQWVKLLEAFGKTGYEFDEMVRTLLNAGDTIALIHLAQAIMPMRSPDVGVNRSGFMCVSDISESGIFDALSTLSDQDQIKNLVEYLVKQINVITVTH